jgi:hypothetical protein
MAALYLWSPTLIDETTVEVIVTRGDLNGIAQGTKEFAAGVLETVGVNADVASWTVTPYRSKYFSEYLGEDDWRDTWQPVWRLAVETTAAVDKVPALATNGLGTEAGDDTATPEKSLSDDAEVRCLVIGDFRSSDDANKAEAGAMETMEEDGRDSPQFREVVLANGTHQLQIDLGPFPATFYAEGAPLAENVIEACEHAGGTTHFQQQPGA